MRRIFLFILFINLLLWACTPDFPNPKNKDRFIYDWPSREEPPTQPEQKRPPVADFVYSPTNARYPDIVYFTNRSTNAHSFLWDFGNNETATSTNAACAFAPGTWTVRLTAYNADRSVKDVVSKTINVRKNYKAFKISRIVVNRLSFTTYNGSGWDSNSGPDVYFQIKENGVEKYRTGRLNDIWKNKLPLIFNCDYEHLNNIFDLSFFMMDWDGVEQDDTMFAFLLTERDIANRKNAITFSDKEFEVTLFLNWIE